MKKGNLSSDTFYYKNNHRFNDKNYILAVRDKNSNSNVISILYYSDKKVLDIAEDMGDKIWTVPNSNDNIPAISARFLENELLKINNYYLVDNHGYLENENRPKSKTYNSNLNPIVDNEVIEIFEGELNEELGTFELAETELIPLVRDLYPQSNSILFVVSGNNLVGPFKIKSVDDSGNFIVEKAHAKPYGFGLYQINDDSFIEFEANEVKRKIIIRSFNSLIFIKELDFVTNSELILKFESELKRNPELYNQEVLNRYIELLKKISPKSFIGDSVLQKRLSNLIKNSENLFLNNIEISRIIPEFDSIKKQIANLEEKRFGLNNEIERIEGHKSKLEKEKENLTLEFNNLNNQVKDLESFKAEELKKNKINLEDEINLLIERKNKIGEEIELERNKKQENINDLEKLIKYLENKQATLESGLKILQDHFTSEQKTAHDKLHELLIQNQHYNILSGREIQTKDPEKLEFYDYRIFRPKDSINNDKLARYRELKEELIRILKDNNRSFSSHFIDNILISIHQNTLTLFAGLPGTGKTSLVRLLINALSPSGRTREIAVGRGWTSQKDLIGFFNPLSKKFHSSSTNLYTLLQQLNWERNEKKDFDAPLSYVLLDEANLSPLEHYWSVFYNLTDSYANDKVGLKINLGDSKTIEYSNNLRFIGTLNYDQTTEELSPRVIDRANIIRMDSQKSNEINSLTSLNTKCIELTFKECIEIFGLLDFNNEVKNIAFDGELEVKFEEIKRKFEDLKIFISSRVQIAIKQYCKIAKKVMVEQNKPLDYCIAQRLLPLINVQGNSSKNKLIDLRDMFQTHEYEISNKILNDIIQIGSEEGGIFQDNFNYFLTLSHV